LILQGIEWIVATITDLWIGGILVDDLIQRGWNTNLVRRSVPIGGMVVGLGILACVRAHTPTAALIGITVSLAGLAAAAPVAWSLPSLISPAASVGTVGGIMNFSSQLPGLAAPINHRLRGVPYSLLRCRPLRCSSISTDRYRRLRFL
jgi:ACS family D-galactonate transporter-like MFS transporter